VPGHVGPLSPTHAATTRQFTPHWFQYVAHNTTYQVIAPATNIPPLTLRRHRYRATRRSRIAAICIASPRHAFASSVVTSSMPMVTSLGVGWDHSLSLGISSAPATPAASPYGMPAGSPFGLHQWRNNNAWGHRYRTAGGGNFNGARRPTTGGRWYSAIINWSSPSWSTNVS